VQAHRRQEGETTVKMERRGGDAVIPGLVCYSIEERCHIYIALHLGAPRGPTKGKLLCPLSPAASRVGEYVVSCSMRSTHLAHASAFTRRNDLLRNRQTLFSWTGTYRRHSTLSGDTRQRE
jgi:hypothetical protein